MRRIGWLVLGMGALFVLLVACEGDDAGDGGGATDLAADTTGGGADAPLTPDDAGDDTATATDTADPGPDAAEPPADGAGGEDGGGETTGSDYVETRLDPVCVGERCAAGPDNAPAPGEWGPFPIGVKTIEFWDENPRFPEDAPRLVRVEIWYPTTNEYADGPYWTYHLETDAPPELHDVFAAIEIDGLPSHAVRDAPIRTEDGPYPLVFFSHGAYGVRFQGVYLTDKLASHGYVVVAPDHSDNTTWDYLLDGYDPVEVMSSGAERQRDGEFLMDTFFDLAADPESEWHGVIATKRVGYTGHSFGGFLSLVMGGNDDRVSVVVPLAPASSMAVLSGINLGLFPLPSLTMGGDIDQTLDFLPYMWRPFLLMPRPKAFLRFYTGGHYTFTDMCSVDVVALAEELGWNDAEDALTDGCGETNFDPATARAIVPHYVIAMFNAHLRQSWESLDYISDERIADYEGEIELFRAFEGDPPSDFPNE